MWIWLFCILNALAAEKAAAPVKVPTVPIYAEKTLDKFKENIQTLEGQLKESKENEETCQKNQETLENEITELDKLEKKQKELIGRYGAYLKKNRATVEKTTQEQIGVKDSVIQEKFKEWLEEANKKIGKVERLVGVSQKNLIDIEAKRESVRTQIAHWQSQEKKFKEITKELNRRKQDQQELLEKGIEQRQEFAKQRAKNEG